MRDIILRCLLAGIFYTFGYYFLERWCAEEKPFHICAIHGLGFTIIMLIINYITYHMRKGKKK